MGFWYKINVILKGFLRSYIWDSKTIKPMGWELPIKLQDHGQSGLDQEYLRVQGAHCLIYDLLFSGDLRKSNLAS